MQSSLRLSLIVACALFLEGIDGTVITTSLPVIAQDMHVAPIALKLALTSYLVSLAVFIPISGWVADRVGAQKTFVSAMIIFMLGSMACAFSRSLEAFVAARFLQGVGGAMMVPVGRLVLLKSIPRSEFVRAMSWVTMPALLGPVIGPPLGGFITTYFHWSWIFFINMPIGVLGVVLALKFVPDLREAHVPAFDLTGFALSALGLSFTMLGLATLWDHMLTPRFSALCILIGSAGIAGYIRHWRRTEHALLDLSLFRFATFRAGVVGGTIFRAGQGATPFLLPLMLQLAFGLSPLQSGFLTFVSAAGALFMKTMATRVLRRWGFRWVMSVNTLLCSAVMALCGFFTADTPHAAIVLILLVGGCLRSLQFTSLNAISYAEVPASAMSQATSIASVGQQLSMSLGVTTGAYALQAASILHRGPALVTADFQIAFFVTSLIALASVGYFWRLSADAGAELAGPPQSLGDAERQASSP